MNRIRSLSALLLTALAATGLGLVACDTEDASSSVVDNAYPESTVVYRAWWFATYYASPIPGGASSDIQRAVPASDFAYAVLAPGWDPASETPPTNLVVVKSKAPFAVERGALVHVTVSDATFAGNCAASQPLSQEEADFITQSIFPGLFTDKIYDAKTCTTKDVTEADAAVDAPAEGG